METSLDCTAYWDSVSAISGGIFNEPKWLSAARVRPAMQVRRTTTSNAGNHSRHVDCGKTLNSACCIATPIYASERRIMFLCIVHCCLASGWRLVAFLET